MSDIEAKVNALINRAVHPNTDENEARNSAFLACKLLRQHGGRITFREALPGIDIEPSAVYEGVKEEVVKDLEKLWESMFGHTFDPSEWGRNENERPKEKPYRSTRAPMRMQCHNCNMQINFGDPMLQEFGPNAQKGTRKVTCMKERCKASWGWTK